MSNLQEYRQFGEVILKFSVSGLGLRVTVQDLGFRVYGLGFRVWG